MHIKLKFKLQPAMKAQRWNRDILYISTLSLTSALEVGWVANATPENASVQEVVWAPEPVCLLEEFVRNNECSVKLIISAKLIGNSVGVREVVVMVVELLLTVSLDRRQQSRKGPPRVQRGLGLDHRIHKSDFDLERRK